MHVFAFFDIIVPLEKSILSEQGDVLFSQTDTFPALRSARNLVLNIAKARK